MPLTAEHYFWLCVHCDLDLGDMTLGQGYDSPSFKDNRCVKYYPYLTRR